MKKQLKLISRSTIMAGLLCVTGAAFAAESSPTPAPQQGGPASLPGRDPNTSTLTVPGGVSKPRVPRDKAAATPAPAAAAATASAGLSAKDTAFLNAAAKGGTMEVHMGQMAEKQGQSDEVKKLGKQIAADHAKANSQLMGLAKKKGVKLNTSHKMAKLDSANFDQAWLGQMVKDHEKTISEFQAAAKGATDAEVKDWASKTLPTLQKHLKMVKAAQGKMKKA